MARHRTRHRTGHPRRLSCSLGSSRLLPPGSTFWSLPDSDCSVAKFGTRLRGGTRNHPGLSPPRTLSGSLARHRLFDLAR